MADRRQTKAQRQEAANENRIWILYGLLGLIVVLYALWNNAFIGAFALILIVYILFMEFRASLKSRGTKQSLYDIAITIGVIAVIWVVLILVLQTTSPVDVVASCSMLPNLQRGDLVLLHGIGNMSQFLSSEHVPVVNVPASTFNSTLSDMSGEWVSYYAYDPADKSMVTSMLRNGYSIGLYNNKCIYTYQYLQQYQNYASCYVNGSAQEGKLIQYNFTVSRVAISGQQSANEVVTSPIRINGQPIIENYSNPIIVYSTTSRDFFPKEDIIHRVYAAIHSGGSYYLLTKGDNNPGLDMEYANYPVNQSDVVGYVVARVPVVGYLKLILSGQLSSVEGCNQTIER
ncbi:MAG: S26 family signal peptidase [Candidatus Micrarchaeota archaeon]|nr:S26 family signal peptidase [Candidatus Micrarchaeota archaeon]